MFKQIYRDQKRALKSILFWACVLIGVALAIFDLYNKAHQEVMRCTLENAI